MKPYQQRVVDAKNELDTKITALDEFIYSNARFGLLPADEQARMKAQLILMKAYSDILLMRVNAF